MNATKVTIATIAQKLLNIFNMNAAAHGEAEAWKMFDDHLTLIQTRRLDIKYVRDQYGVIYKDPRVWYMLSDCSVLVVPSGGYSTTPFEFDTERELIENSKQVTEELADAGFEAYLAYKTAPVTEEPKPKDEPHASEQPGAMSPATPEEAALFLSALNVIGGVMGLEPCNCPRCTAARARMN